MIQFHRMDEKDLAGFHEAWSRLLQRSGQKFVFLNSEWLYSWWRHFYHDKTLFLLCAYEGDELVAICRFCLVAQATLLGARNTLLTFMGTEKVSSEYLDIICAPQ